jgi:hypothetical protein
MGTLLGSGILFGVFYAFLKFLLKDFLKELLSDGTEKVIEVVKGTPVGGGVGDEVALGKQGIEFGVKEGLHCARGETCRHKYFLVKNSRRRHSTICPLFFYTPLEFYDSRTPLTHREKTVKLHCPNWRSA